MEILFVGNSYTFYNDVPAQVCGHLKRLGMDATARVCAEGGATLTRHWEELGSRKFVEQGPMDLLVLQDQSTRPLHNRKEFLADMERFATAAPDNCKLMLYQTWPREPGHAVYESRWSMGSPPKMTEAVAHAYEEAKAKIEKSGRRVEIAPVGSIWLQILEGDDMHSLYDEDGHHASPLGSALAAWVIARTVAARPLNLPEAGFPGLGDRKSSELAETLEMGMA